MTPKEHQNLQRLKVNRIAVIQELRVDHILQTLQQSSVLDENDTELITSGQSMHEKTKRLLDILPTKGRSSNWYKHFRAALLNPRVDDITTRVKYQNLVEFLDNTIIDRMIHPIRLPQTTKLQQAKGYSKYAPLPSIARNDSRPPTDLKLSKQLVRNNTDMSAAERKPSPETIETAKEEKSSSSQTQWNIEDLNSEFNRKATWLLLKSFQNVFPSLPPSLIETAIPFSILFWEEDPEGFKSCLEFSQKEIDDLERSNHKADNALAKQEMHVYSKMRQVEIAYFFLKKQIMPDDSVFCTCSAVLDVIQNPVQHHLYQRYFYLLLKEFDMDISQEIVQSFDEVTQWTVCEADPNTMDNIVKLGLNLVRFLSNMALYELAKQVISSVLTFLASQEGLELWVPLYRVYVQAMTLNNGNFDFSEADKFYRLAQSMREKIGMMSFGQEILDCSELFLQTSVMMGEQGSFGPSYTWAQKSMQA